MKIAVLGSGSAGNSLVLDSQDGDYWIFDVGFSAKQIRLRLEQLMIPIEKVRGVFISHEHRDHVAGLPVFTKKCPTKVYVSELTHEYLSSQLGYNADWSVFEPGQTFRAGSLKVEPVSIPHDATDPVGFIITQNDQKAAMISDLGYVSDSLRQRLKGIELLYLESNYDVKLLEMDQKRPWAIKQRISSRHGHLSNQQALDLISSLRPDGLEKVIFGHLSRDCNTPECIESLMNDSGLSDGLEYHISRQEAPTPWIEMTPIAQPAKLLNHQQLGLF